MPKLRDDSTSVVENLETSTIEAVAMILIPIPNRNAIEYMNITDGKTNADVHKIYATVHGAELFLVTLKNKLILCF